MLKTNNTAKKSALSAIANAFGNFRTTAEKGQPSARSVKLAEVEVRRGERKRAALADLKAGCHLKRKNSRMSARMFVACVVVALRAGASVREVLETGVADRAAFSVAEDAIREFAAASKVDADRLCASLGIVTAEAVDREFVAMADAEDDSEDDGGEDTSEEIARADAEAMADAVRAGEESARAEEAAHLAAEVARIEAERVAKKPAKKPDAKGRSRKTAE